MSNLNLPRNWETITQSLITSRRQPDVPSRMRNAHNVSLVAAALLLIYDSTHQWFHQDEWNFLAFRSVNLYSLFLPHNVHWLTIPILIWRGLFNLVGVRYYWLYALPLIIAHLVVAHLLWRLMLRHDVEPWTATALVATFLVLGVGSSDLLWAFQIGFVGSLAFGLAAVEAIEHDRPWLSVLWSVCALMCSGIGVPMVAGCGLVALAGRKFKTAVIVVLVPAVVFLIWWVKIGHLGAALALHLSVGSLASYLWTGLTASVAGYFGLSRFVGAVLVVGMAGAAVWRRNVPAALAATTIALYVFVGTGRVNEGVNEAAIPRYSYLAIALLLPLAGQLITTLVRFRVLKPMVFAGLILLIGVNGYVLQRDAHDLAKQWRPSHRLLDAAASLVSRGARFSGASLPIGSQTFGVGSTLTLVQLEYWVRHGQFPVPDRVLPGDLRYERAVLSVFTSPMRANSGAVTFSGVTAPTCLRLPAGMPITVNLSASGSLRVEPSDPMAFSVNAPIFVTVELNPPPGQRGQVVALAFMKPTDQWLNLPGGRYRSAKVTVINDAPLVCQGSG